MELVELARFGRETCQDLLGRDATQAAVDYGSYSRSRDTVSGRAHTGFGYPDSDQNVGIYQATEQGRRAYRLHDHPLPRGSRFALQDRCNHRSWRDKGERFPDRIERETWWRHTGDAAQRRTRHQDFPSEAYQKFPK